MKQTFEISTATILKFFAVVLGLFFLYLIRRILLMLFIAVIIASAVDGPVDWMVKHKIRRGLAVAMVYVAGIALLALILYLIIPPLASQVGVLTANMPSYLGQLESKVQWLGGHFGVISLQDVLNNISERLTSAAGDILATTINIFGGVLSALLTLIISIYLATQEKSVKKFFISLVASKHESYTANLVDRILDKLGAWFRGQLILMAVIGVMTFAGLSLLKIKFALTLALITALLEIVPIIGPILAAIPAILVALVESFGLALFVAAMFYVIQELEKYLIVPQVMKRALGLNPIAIMVAVLIGAEVYGILGAVIAIPVAAIISIGWSDFRERQKTLSEQS